MRRELKNIAEYQKPSNDAFASVVRSFGEANSRFQALAVESVGRAVEIQSQFVGKAYENYISEISSSKGCSSSGTEPSLLGHKNCHMLISTKKKPPIGSRARRLKSMSIPSPRGDAPPPRV